MSDAQVWGIVLTATSIIVSLLLWTADRHSKTLEKFDRRLTAHLQQEEADVQVISQSLTEIRSDLAATRVDVAFVAGRQGIDLPPR